jgi:hypothetical protein
VVGLWKHALYTVSNEKVTSWSEVKTAENVLNGGGKIWGQKTSDGRYAIVYNPDKIERYPLAIMTSDNGLAYDSLLCLHGEVSPCRYRGTYKDYGPQYIRGIIEGNGTPPHGKMWVTYSMNKEDIWVSSISVPVKSIGSGRINDVFSNMSDGSELSNWNIYSPLWAPVKIEKNPAGEKNLVLRDKDRYDYAKATRIFKPGENIDISFSLILSQNTRLLHVELQNNKGDVAVNLIFDEEGTVKINNRQAFEKLDDYNAGEEYELKISTGSDEKFSVSINGKSKNNLRLASSHIGLIERIVFRTGESFGKPKADPVLEEDQLQISPGRIDLPYCGEMEEESSFAIKYLKIDSR